MNATFASQILDEHEIPIQEKTQLSPAKQPADILSVTLLPIVAAIVGLLPVVYLALAGLIGWGAWECASLITTSFSHLTGHLRISIAFLPAIPAALLITALIRPIFSIRKTRPGAFPVSREDEPLLISFVQRIADATGSPRPLTIELDCEPRISAAFRNVLRGPDLRVVIGMPLLAEFSLQSFGGALARELGPFSHPAAVRLQRFVQSVHSVFQRMAEWRSPLESRIEKIAGGSDRPGDEGRDWKAWVVVLSLNSVRAVIVLVRQLLRQFARLSQAAGAFTIRHLEYRADACQIALSGSENFNTTVRGLARLETASDLARNRIADLQGEDRLSRDYSDLICHLSNTLPADFQTAVREKCNCSSSWMEFRPSIKERIQAAYRRDDAGIFSPEKPASSLIRDRDSLGEIVTRHWYRSEWGVDPNRFELVSTAAIHRDTRTADRQIEEASRFFGGGLNPCRPIFPARKTIEKITSLSEIPTEDIPKHAAAASKQNREQLERFDELVQARLQAVEYHQLALAGYSIDPGNSSQKDNDPDSLNSIITFLDRQLLQASVKLGVFEGHNLQMIAAALRNIGRGRVKNAQLDVWFHHLAVIEQIYTVIPELKDLETRLGALVRRQPDSDLSAQCGERFEIHVRVCELLKRIEDYLGNLPCPFGDFGDNATMWDYLTTDVGMRSEAIAQSSAIANAVIERVGEFYLRVMGQLAIDLDQEPDDDDSTLFDRWAKLASL